MAFVVSLDHLGDEVDPDQLVVNKELSLTGTLARWRAGLTFDVIEVRTLCLLAGALRGASRVAQRSPQGRHPQNPRRDRPCDRHSGTTPKGPSVQCFKFEVPHI